MKKNKEFFTLKKMEEKFDAVFSKYVPVQKTVDLSALKAPTGQFKLPTLRRIPSNIKINVSGSGNEKAVTKV